MPWADVTREIDLSARWQGSKFPSKVASCGGYNNVQGKNRVPVALTTAINSTGRRQTLRRGAWAFQQLIEHPYNSEHWSKWANKFDEGPTSCPPQVYLAFRPRSNFSFLPSIVLSDHLSLALATQHSLKYSSLSI